MVTCDPNKTADLHGAPMFVHEAFGDVKSALGIQRRHCFCMGVQHSGTYIIVSSVQLLDRLTSSRVSKHRLGSYSRISSSGLQAYAYMGLKPTSAQTLESLAAKHVVPAAR